MTLDANAQETLEKTQIGNSPWRQRINDLLGAVESHNKAGRKWLHSKNQTTGMIVFHATELSDMATEITAGNRDELGYVIEETEGGDRHHSRAD